MWFQELQIPAVHESGFHQAGPSAYNATVLHDNSRAAMLPPQRGDLRAKRVRIVLNGQRDKFCCAGNDPDFEIGIPMPAVAFTLSFHSALEGACVATIVHVLGT